MESKKLLSIFLALLVAFSLIVPNFAFAQDYNDYDWYQVNSTRSAQEMYGRMVRTSLISKSLTESEVSFQQNDGIAASLKSGEFQHDAQIVYHSGTNSIYTVFVANKETNGDSPYSNSAFVRLQKLNESGGKIRANEYWDVAKNGDAFALSSKGYTNYFDSSSQFINAYVYNSKVTPDDSGKWCLSDYMPIADIDSLVFRDFDFENYADGYRVILNCYDNDKNYISQASTNTSNANAFINKCKWFYNIPANTKYIRLQIFQSIKNHRIVLTKPSEYTDDYSLYSELSNLNYYKVASKDGYSEVKTINSGAGIPNCYLVGDTIYIIWTSRCDDGKWYEFVCDFDCKTNTLGTPKMCKLDGSFMTCQSIASHLNLTHNGAISINASIADVNGAYYACACADDVFKNGAMLKTKDFVNWEFCFEPQFDGIESNAIYEGAVGYQPNLPAENNVIYLALRQKNNDSSTTTTPMILAKFTTDGKLIDNVVLPSVCSRPSFVNIGWRLILLMPTCNRENTVGVLVSWYNGKLRDSYPIFDTGYPFGNYLQMVQKGYNTVYTVRTYGNNGVRVGIANVISPDDSQAGSYFTHDHIESEVVIENQVKPTCWDDGYYYEVTRCTICGTEMSSKKIVVPQLDYEDHSFVYEKVEATCQERGYDKYTCKNCGYSYKNNFKDIVEHRFDSTAFIDGELVVVCKYCKLPNGETFMDYHNTFSNNGVFDINKDYFVNAKDYAEFSNEEKE